jgi:hypothetical protein
MSSAAAGRSAGGMAEERVTQVDRQSVCDVTWKGTRSRLMPEDPT